MDDILNQETSTEEGLFDDYTEDTTEAVDETTTESTDESAESTEQVEAPAPFLRVTYNGEDRDLSEEDARTLAQKGMNYDRFYDPLERLARANNMTVGEYINRLNDTEFAYEVTQEMENLRQDPKYENVNDDVLEEIAQNRVKENVNLRNENYDSEQRAMADAQQQKIKRDVDLFLNEYPEFRGKGPDAIDEKVYDYTKQGYTLLEAYNKWYRETNSIEAKEKANKLNEENKRKSLGNTANAGNVDSDDFLNGFLKG